MVEEIAVRPAHAEDRDDVLNFCMHTWADGDYIEYVWEDWLQDADGRLLVAMVDERPAGLIHMRMLSETEAWLEGLRVAPDYRGRGLARELFLAAQAEAMRRGATVARLVVDATNTRSRQVSEGNHMREVGAFSVYRAEPSVQEQASGERTRVATLEDLDAIIDYLNLSNIFPAAGGLYYRGFTAREITEVFLREKIAESQIYCLWRWERLDGLAIAEARAERDQQRLSVGYIDGTTIEAMSLIAYDLRRWSGEMELDVVRIYAPDLVLVRDALGGLDYDWNGSVFYTYERALV